MEPEGSSPCSQQPTTGPYVNRNRGATSVLWNPNAYHSVLSQLHAVGNPRRFAYNHLRPSIIFPNQNVVCTSDVNLLLLES
jgi:hypothetical protein